MSENSSREIAKYWWLQCVSCSEASMTAQLREFGLEDVVYEQASHAFYGGFMYLGHACGILTGAVLAAGLAAKTRFDGEERQAAAALFAAIQLAEAYGELTGSVNCREITGVDLAGVNGRLRYIREGTGQVCGRFYMNWSDQAHELLEQAFADFEAHDPPPACANCAVMTLKKVAAAVGMKEEDAVLAAGLAGGVGLRGNVCGALAAGVYALSVAHYRERKERDSQMRAIFQGMTGSSFRGPAMQLKQAFNGRFGSELCRQIVQRPFPDIEAYSAFIEQGGCRDVVAFVAEWVESPHNLTVAFGNGGI
jgi:C_GCAxxG_C_C family probable redox protein